MTDERIRDIQRECERAIKEGGKALVTREEIRDIARELLGRRAGETLMARMRDMGAEELAEFVKRYNEFDPKKETGHGKD